MSWKRWPVIGFLAMCLVLSGTALGSWGEPAVWAQDYSFALDRNISHVVVNRDGSADIEYWLTFTGDPGAHPVDIVDVGLPNASYDLDSAQAWFSPGAGGGQETPLNDIRRSEFVDIGVEIHLGEHTIQPGDTGTVHLRVNVREMVYPDQDETYASVEFIPHYYDSQYVHGPTYLETHFFFPPGVTNEETRYHDQEPDEVDMRDDRIVFIYVHPDGTGSERYKHGISFPRSYVDQVIKAPVVVESPGSTVGSTRDPLIGFIQDIPNCGCTGGFFALILGIMGFSVYNSRKRKMKYLPPALSVEGVGIKRGLTAVEAAILLELPLNRVLTMILFGLLKKRAITVLKEEPLKVEAVSPLPEGKLRSYETGFLESVKKDGTLDEAELRKVLIALIKEVNKKMKGFSRKETVAYYRSIVDRAWDQVSSATAPEVKSKYFDQGLEWMMMDEKFEDRSTQTLGTGPFVMPPWWAYYRPWVPVVRTSRVPSSPAGGSGGSRPSTGRGSGGSRQVTLPTLPGAAFASTVVVGMENTASNIVGRVEQFTGGVTQGTNPAAVKSGSSSKSYRSGGCACACACACAGCACACAGGGR